MNHQSSFSLTLPRCGAALLVAAGLLLPQAKAHADTLLFSDNFDSGNSGANWTVNRGGGTDSFANFAFDYSTLGIGAAPNSAGGSTIGARFLVNQGAPANNGTTNTAGVFQGISASPTGQSFTGDFRIQFDAFYNFVGPSPAGGSGSTQIGAFGYGVPDNKAQFPGTNVDGVLFGATLDGNSGTDYRAYLKTAGAPLAASTGVYAAGTGATAQNNTDAYYAPLGNASAPAAQTALYASQTGTTATGTFGMKWRDVILDKTGNSISWSVDGLRIATVDYTGQTLNGTNLFLGMFDSNAASSTDPNDFLNAAIYDNLRVTQVAPVPEPGTWAMMSLGCLALGIVGWRRKRGEVAANSAALAT